MALHAQLLLHEQAQPERPLRRSEVATKESPLTWMTAPHCQSTCGEVLSVICRVRSDGSRVLGSWSTGDVGGFAGSFRRGRTPDQSLCTAACCSQDRDEGRQRPRLLTRFVLVRFWPGMQLCQGAQQTTIHPSHRSVAGQSEIGSAVRKLRLERPRVRLAAEHPARWWCLEGAATSLCRFGIESLKLRG